MTHLASLVAPLYKVFFPVWERGTTISKHLVILPKGMRKGVCITTPSVLVLVRAYTCACGALSRRLAPFQ